METIRETNFEFAGQKGFYKGKVRDVYFVGDKLVVVASDRISAFDCILERAIPYKGQVLNKIAAGFLEATKDIVPNWVEAIPHPNVAIGKRCEPLKVEMVIRGYLSGHAWREYKAGKRELCGVPMPDGMKENDKFPEPIITPTTKADQGHDEDISRYEIISQGLVDAAVYEQVEDYTRKLFARGTEIAARRGLILVDTKYEFGINNGEVYLIDEVHTPDSSRYFHQVSYDLLQSKGEPQRQLSKEFVRQWLIENGFQGKEGQQMPEMTDEFVQMVSDRYIELYEHIMGESFEKKSDECNHKSIESAIFTFFEKQKQTQIH